jgi:hypothetical protein
MQSGIGDLERLFESNHADPQTLEALEYELKFRSVPRAASLLKKVRGAMNGTPIVPVASQKALFDHAPLVQTQETLSTKAALVAAPVIEEAPMPRPQLSIEDACNILKVSAVASWDTIEQSRRAIVELTRPDRMAKLSDKNRHALRHDAQMANAALDALFEARKAR